MVVDALAIGRYLLRGTCVMFYIISPSELALGEDDPQPKYLLHYGIPFFFIMQLVEWALYKLHNPRRGEQTPRLNDSLVGTLLGTFQTVSLLVFDVLGCALESTFYKLAYDNLALTHIDSKEYVMLSYVGLMLGKDLGYYWAHRSFHEWHIMWVGHSVHHSGEDYNLATGLRQGVMQPLFGWMFYIPLAILGFHPRAFAAHAQLNTLYMYWIRTYTAFMCMRVRMRLSPGPLLSVLRGSSLGYSVCL